MRAKPDEQLVFIYLLASADRNGAVEERHDEISYRTGLTLEAVKSALAKLEAPDPESRTPDEDGRRLVRLDDHRDWAWIIVNYEKYRAIQRAEQKTELTAARVRKWRERVRKRKAQEERLGGIPVDEEEEIEMEAELMARREVDREERADRPPALEEPPGPGEESPRQWAEGFEPFWRRYPRKVGKEAALKAYMKLKPRTQETFDLLCAGLMKHIAEEWQGREPEKIPHAATWLNQGRFRDAEGEVERWVNV